MDKRFAIFDMDGTIIDSMGYWADLARDYLATQGVTGLPDAFYDSLVPLTVMESAELFIREFGIPHSPEDICRQLNDLVEHHYLYDIPLKPGAGEYLARLKAEGVRLCVASATAAPLIEACLRRLGVLDCFSFTLSCEEVGCGKDRPDIYFEAARRLGGSPAETAVFEDSLFAGRTAKAAGFHLVGVYDGPSRQNWPRLSALADETILDYGDCR